MKKHTKKRLKFKAVFLLLFVLAIIGFALYFGFKLISKLMYVEPTYEAFLGSNDYQIQLYDLEYNKVKEVSRGYKVTLYEKDVIQTLDKGTKDKSDDEHITYRKIKIGEDFYLVKPENMVDKYEDSVFEKEKFVRTSVTLYKNETDPDIAGFLPKGTTLEVTGFDEIKDDGSINMYKVKTGDTEGYVFSKYLTDTLESAQAVYNENGTHDIHKDRRYSYELYGGSPSVLDYYPYEHPTFEDNPFVEEAKAYYLVGTYYVLAEVDKYINLAKNAGATAFVVDIKDGALAYKSPVAQSYSPTSFNSGMNEVDFYKAAIQKIKDAGFYVIGRIVLFNDPQYAKDHPDECISYSGGSTSWVSAYSRNAWEYNVKLALEAVELFDFNEIQFDYVRFPEKSYYWSKANYDFKNKYGEEKAQAIQNFLFYATDQIHKTNTYISIDVFGECSSGYVTAYGQYWPAISNIVDVVSGMPYTDHFDRNNSNYWTKPYNTLLNWGKTAAARQTEIPTPGKVRTWITAYNTPYWGVTTIYGANEVYQQVKGLKDAGLGSGFITWNSSSNYAKYEQIAGAFSREY